MNYNKLLPIFCAFAIFVIGSALSQETRSYEEWAAAHGLSGEDARPGANPDGDRFINALEYAFGSNPLVPGNPAELGPRLETDGSGAAFNYRLSKRSEARVRVLQSSNLKNWRPLPGAPAVVEESAEELVLSHPIPPNREMFYVLEVTVMSATFGNTVITVGTQVGSAWEGLPPFPQVDIVTQPPATGPDDPAPNTSKYPVAAGASLGAFTPDLLADYASSSLKRPPLRSWMGWFLWGNGTPPEGINPGIFTNPSGYGEYTGTDWDYFNFQWPKDEGREAGSWNAVRLDQQPLYLNPLTVNYNWAPGMYGYVSQPLENFPLNTFYWKDKRIVRGVNISGTVPFFYQYGDLVTSSAVPAAWQQAWLYLAKRPLETTVVVPSNLSPDRLLEDGPWNRLPDETHNAFPYPVWDTTRPAADQTPFAIQVDRIGDMDADLIWEAVNPRAGEYYEQNRYQRTEFNQPGKGNYMKMTVAQGSPFVWFETNNCKFAIFYNLIRTNIPGQIDNNDGTGATTLQDGPYEVPGVKGVHFVLLYGDHVNPNQWHQEVQPWYATLGGDEIKDTGLPGGFNPPPGPYRTKSGETINAAGQHNHTYTAIFYRDDSVRPVQVGQFGRNAGTDSQGNPYFYLEFMRPDKNWFVLGSVPEMRYYHSDVPQDGEAARKAAAIAWAQEMGKYAFNFLTETKIDYSVTNMFQTSTKHQFKLQNPYVAANVPGAANLSVPNETVIALNPHQYQPIRLGPDLTRAGQPEVVWNPLAKGYGKDFPMAAASGIPNANKTNPSTASRWGYWSLRGNLKAIITKEFSTIYPFQNFLPVLPPPDYEDRIAQTGVAGVNITNAGTGYEKISSDPVVTITDASGKGVGAQARAVVNQFTGEIDRILVTSGGTGYPDGLPPEGVTVTVSAPPVVTPGSRAATAYVQTGGGSVLAVFMTDKGAGYASTIAATQAPPNNIDPPIIIPRFDQAGNMLAGPADIIEAGSGFDFSQPTTLTIFGTGTGATAEVVKPGSILNILPAGGGVGANGRYPSTGAAPSLSVFVPPPAAGQPAQQAAATMSKIVNDFQPVVMNRGQYESEPTASFLDDDNNPVDLNVIFHAGQVLDVTLKTPANISSPRDVTFAGGSPTVEAVARVYPVYSLAAATPTSPMAGGYNSAVQVSFIGEDISDVPGITPPEIGFTIPADGMIRPEDVTITNAGSGLTYNIDFEIAGGRGFDAVLQPIINENGSIVTVKVLRGGSNYLPNGQVYAYIVNPQHTGGDFAELAVRVTQDGSIEAVDVVKPGSGYTDSLVIQLTSDPPPFTPPPDTVVNANPKGVPVRFSAQVDENGQVTSLIQQGLPPDKTRMRYIPGSEGQATVASTPAFIWWTSLTPFARVTGLAGGYLANPAPVESRVADTLYSSIISQYTLLAGTNLAPFGGGYTGASAPDGYGLGGSLSAASKFIGDIFNMQQALGNNPDAVPADYAVNAARTPVDSFDFPIFQEHSPFVTMSGALKSSVQGLQRSISGLFLHPASQNHPDPASTSTWLMEYFSLYDEGVGRLLINPTATQPAWGVISSVENPATIPAAENDPKEGLSRWQKGMLWSGFTVSDQWNDQHYFYGYYLSSAALAGIFDRAWEPSINSQPADLWAGPNQMGTALDQMVLTLAYDPDNPALLAALYTNPQFKYQKFAYFDQWNGHAWAAGLSPGSTTAVLDTDNAIGYWGAFGTLNDKYNGENENSIFEGIQAWSATILWGGASDRKAVVDLGIYLYSTSIAAADAYFLDKNYNATDSPNNQYSWVPVTTIAADQVPKNGNNSWPVNTSYATGTPEAYYIAPQFFGDARGSEASPGQSLTKKVENTLNNYFYAYPTGSKFIQAYPPAPWTMGMVRNTNFMRKWAGAMMREEWKQARESALFQPAIWNSMALTCALAGVPYNPGDMPYPMTGTEPNMPPLQTFPDRLWSSWVTPNQRPGAEATLNPPYLATSVLTFLLSLQKYGTPDWTYIGRVTDASGKDDNDSVLFMAAFSRPVENDQVRTTFVAFNPGWSTRHAVFQRLNLDGTINSQPVSGANPLPVSPKRMVTLTQTFNVR